MATDLQSIIGAFPQPASMNFSISRDWGPESQGIFGPLFENGGFNWTKDAAKQSGATLAGKIIQGLSGASLEAAIQAGYAVSLNKRNAVLFRDLPFREISLSWVLRPRTPEKAEAYAKAINLLKVKSAPKLSNHSATWDVSDCVWSLIIDPSQSGPPISGGGGPTKILFQSQEMVITQINVDYTPNGFWSQHKDGWPTQINLGISLLETQLAWNRGGDYLKNRKGQEVI